MTFDEATRKAWAARFRRVADIVETTPDLGDAGMIVVALAVEMANYVGGDFRSMALDGIDKAESIVLKKGKPQA